MKNDIVKIDSKIIDKICNDEKLGGNSIGCCVTYMVILSYWKRNDIYGCYPSLSTISKRIGKSPRTVSRYIKDLADNGYIEISSGKYGVNNNYFFPFENDYTQPELCIRRIIESKKEKSEEIDYSKYSNNNNSENNVDKF